MPEHSDINVPAVAIGALTGAVGSVLGVRLSSRRRLDLGALELAAIAGGYPAMAFYEASGSAMAIEFAVSGVFIGLALTGLERRSRLAIALGLVGHAGWDAIHHLTDTGAKPPRWFPAFCMVADIALAVQFARSS
jgi:hypothetical protein